MRRVSPEIFAAALERARHTERGAFLSPYSADDLRDSVCLLALDGQAGGAVKPASDGELEAVSVFSLERGRGAAVLEALVAHGARRLDCLGEGLRRYYERAGWAVREVISWADEYAPAGWNYDAHGRPDVYVLELERHTEVAA